MSPVAEDGAFRLPRNSWYYYTAAASRYCYRFGSSIEAEGSSGVLRGDDGRSPMTLKTVAGRAPNIAIKRRSALGRLDMLGAIAYTLHVILAGVWQGGVVFTTTVVSPALVSVGWDEAEQARV